MMVGTEEPVSSTVIHCQTATSDAFVVNKGVSVLLAVGETPAFGAFGTDVLHTVADLFVVVVVVVVVFVRVEGGLGNGIHII
jgi:hypothetical protein